MASPELRENSRLFREPGSNVAPNERNHVPGPTCISSGPDFTPIKVGAINGSLIKLSISHFYSDGSVGTMIQYM